MSKKILAAAALAATVLWAKAAKLETMHEGRRAHVYDDKDGAPLRDGYRTRDAMPCKGHPTVGIGCNLDRPNARMRLADVGANYDAVRMGHADLTDEQIDEIFRRDLADVFREVSRYIAGFEGLPEIVQLVLIDMSFNMGMGKLLKFERMLAAVGVSDWREMIREMIDSDWYRGATKARAKSDIELLRQAFYLDDHAQPLTTEERANVAAMAAIALDMTVADGLSPRHA
jgi:GH24 family phage-related lysozyme (muramidase)